MLASSGDATLLPFTENSAGGNGVTVQGFGGGSFDLVVAANVLHATPDMGVTLANTRFLLAPGGVALLLERTRPTLWVDIIFGLLKVCSRGPRRFPGYLTQFLVGVYACAQLVTHISHCIHIRKRAPMSLE